jgi:hypothetical protein
MNDNNHEELESVIGDLMMKYALESEGMLSQIYRFVLYLEY